MGHISGSDRSQASLLPPCVDDYVAPEALVRIVDAFVASLDLAELGFARAVAEQLHVLTDGGYSNAEEVARCEHEEITVSAPIKRGAMNSDHFRPTQFVYDEASDTIHCPGGQTMRPSGKHTRNRAIRYRTSACETCSLKPRCTPGAQRTIHRLFDQAALDRMEARIYADPNLMRI